MKFLLFLLSICFTSLGCWAQTSVMSYNIRYNNPSDGENRWDLRKARLTQKVVLDDCDIIGFQEVLDSQIDYLDSVLVDYDWVGVGRDDGKRGGEFAPIFYKTDKFTVDNWGTQWLSETPSVPSLGWDAACIRIACWAVLRSVEDGSCMLFINTHFDHVGQQARLNGSKSIVSLADSLKQIYEGLPLVLTGDFNSVVQDPALVPIMGSFRYGMDGCANPVAPSYIGFPHENVTPSLIDHIFVRDFTVSDYVVDVENYGLGFLSDHLSVRCIVSK